MRSFYILFFVLVGCSEIETNVDDCGVVTYSNSPKIDWFFSYGGSGEESHGHYILECSDGGFLQVGETVFSPANKKILLVKVNSLGSLVWKREYTNGGNSFGNSIAEVSDGYFISGGENDNSLIIKVDKSNGNVVFKKTFDNGGADSIEQIAFVEDKIYAIGYVNSEDKYNSFFSEGQGVVSVLNMNGDFVKTIDLNSHMSHAYRVSFFENNLYISGISDGAEDYSLIKMGLDENIVWSYKYGGANQDHCFGMDISNDGSIFLTGHTLSGTENWDTYTMRISSNGEQLWENKVGNPRGFNPVYIHDEAWGVSATNDGGCIIVAGTGDEYDNYSAVCEKTGENSNTWSIYLVRYDVNGNIIWENTFGASEEDWAGEDLKITNNGNIIIGVDNGQFGFLKTKGF